MPMRRASAKYSAVLSLFDICNSQSNYNNTTSQPNYAFTSKQSAFNLWVKDPTALKIIYPLINDILKLSEHIQEVSTKSTGIAKLAVIYEKKNSTNEVLPFTGVIPDYLIPKAFLYAALAAFRANVYWDATNGKIGWIIDPVILCDKCYVDLFKRISSAYKTSYHNEIKKVGSEAMLWEILYTAVDNIVQVERAKGSKYKEYDI